MKRLAIIPARKGSKGLPGKNLMEINGESLVARAVRCAKESGVFSSIFVSSEDTEILWVGGRAGGFPCPRPKELATDEATITDVVRHCLEEFDKYRGFDDMPDVVAVLQPTSPTRTPEIVRQCVEAIGGEFDAAWTVSEVPHAYNAWRQLLLDDDAVFGPMLNGPGLSERRRQDMPPRYAKNGQCYAVTTQAFKEDGLCGTRCRPVITTAPFITIDTQADLDEARRVLNV